MKKKRIFWFHSLYVLRESAKIVNKEQLKQETRSDNPPGRRVSVVFSMSLFRCSSFYHVSCVPVVSFGVSIVSLVSFRCFVPAFPWCRRFRLSRSGGFVSVFRV